ncbi:MAG: peptide chain release factor N(5)-glutamine methyltransferase [Bacteroidota bacterium]
MIELNRIETTEEALRKGCQALLEHGIGSGALEASILLGMATGLDRLALITHPSRPLSPSEKETFLSLLERRFRHEPIQYLKGTQEFMGLSFVVRPGVLIPRPDTEILVEAVLDACEEYESPRIVDVGTGSGAIAVSLKAFLPRASVTATDLSPEALAVARENAQRNDADVLFFEGSGLAPLEGRVFDFFVSNPPYIPSEEVLTLDSEVKDYEPRLALDGGEDGLDWYRLFAKEAGRFLVPGGWIFLEVGADQAPEVKKLLEENEWREVGTREDLSGIERVVFGRKG